MSTFDEALDYAFQDEGGFTDNPHDHGGPTKYGITQPTLIRAQKDGIVTCLSISEITREDAKIMYYTYYWYGKFDGVLNPRVATKLFDIFINMPPSNAVRNYQRALNACFDGSKQLLLDGQMGPKTKMAFNMVDPDCFLKQLASTLTDYYKGLVAAEPDQGIFLKGWLRRANRIPE